MAVQLNTELSTELSNELSNFALEMAAASETATLGHFRQTIAIDNKLVKGFDPVTEGDREAEKIMRQMIEGKIAQLGQRHPVQHIAFHQGYAIRHIARFIRVSTDRNNLHTLPDQLPDRCQTNTRGTTKNNCFFFLQNPSVLFPVTD